MKFLAAIALAMTLATGAQAATVASGVTAVGDTGGIDAQGAAVAIASNNSAYFSGATTPASAWVWVGNINTVNNVVFEFTFDLTGYDVTTASLSGLWGVDNTGTIALNGTPIASLTSVVSGNYTALRSYGTSLASLFNAGSNTVTYNMIDNGGPGAFRATAEVTADVSAVPLPAGAPLLVGGLALLGWMRKRKA